jgi:hypothetical protein
MVDPNNRSKTCNTFYETFFDNMAETAAKTAFKKWREDDNPFYYESGWNGWPQDAEQENV